MMKPLTSRISYTAAVVLMLLLPVTSRGRGRPKPRTGKPWLESYLATLGLTRRNGRSWNPATS